MAATYTIRGGSFVVQKLRQWQQQSRLADTGVLANLDLVPDGQRMVVLAPATNPDERQAGNHVTFMLNFFDEVQRRVSSVGR